MKKLLTICLIMATVFTVNAQDGKPTKEQTLEYLQSVLLEVIGGQIIISKGEGTIYSLSEMKLDGCILKMKSKEGDINIKFSKRHLVESDYIQKIDLSEVESFRFTLEKFSSDIFKNYNDNLSLYFATKESKNGEIVGFYCTPENSEKALKALNHLRKLCGAPDPISFD
jgi:hypothetical protein